MLKEGVRILDWEVATCLLGGEAWANLPVLAVRTHSRHEEGSSSYLPVQGCQVRHCVVGCFYGNLEWCVNYTSTWFRACDAPLLVRCGCGAVWNDHWLQHLWHSTPTGRAIAVLELVPIAIACMVWGPQWRGSQVVAHSNTQAIVCVINASYSREKI